MVVFFGVGGSCSRGDVVVVVVVVFLGADVQNADRQPRDGDEILTADSAAGCLRGVWVGRGSVVVVVVVVP